MVVRFGDRKRIRITDSALYKRGGELPCLRCGFRYQRYSFYVKKIVGNKILCKFCFDSETD
jgi:hypothetical protein